MVSRQARNMAQSGIAVVVPDLYGAGDSACEFGVIDWNAWKTQLTFLLQWVRERSDLKITVWGLRLGCLLAVDVLQDSDCPVCSLLLWQPVQSGKLFMGQFLRLRMAAAMMKGEGESVAAVRERLISGECVEVAGYSLPPALYQQLEFVDLGKLTIPCDTHLQIYEVASGDTQSLMPVTERRIENWRASGIDCVGKAAQGEPFWMTQELGFSSELIAASTAGMEKLVSAVAGSTEVSVGDIASKLNLEEINPDDGARPVLFTCHSETLVGILHEVPQEKTRGVLIVVGGPQYRVGSHRQFVYLAQELARQGIPVFRFDYRGMGDSTGELCGFDVIDADIRSAIDAFFASCSGLAEVTIWGLCDAATAAAFYAPGDPRVTGLVLANPWVFSPQGAAKAYLKHYYIERFFSKAFWHKIFSGRYNPLQSAKSLMGMISQASGETGRSDLSVPADPVSTSGLAESSGNLTERLAKSLGHFDGKVLLILSGDDLTASEFKDAVRSNRRLQCVLSDNNLRRVDLDSADHTFSKISWRQMVDQLSVEWVRSY